MQTFRKRTKKEQEPYNTNHILDMMVLGDKRVIQWKPTTVKISDFNKSNDNDVLKAYCNKKHLDFQTLQKYMH